VLTYDQSPEIKINGAKKANYFATPKTNSNKIGVACFTNAKDERSVKNNVSPITVNPDLRLSI
jgi:hypothetical protein